MTDADVMVALDVLQDSSSLEHQLWAITVLEASGVLPRLPSPIIRRDMDKSRSAAGRGRRSGSTSNGRFKSRDLSLTFEEALSWERSRSSCVVGPLVSSLSSSGDFWTVVNRMAQQTSRGRRTLLELRRLMASGTGYEVHARRTGRIERGVAIHEALHRAEHDRRR